MRSAVRFVLGLCLTLGCAQAASAQVAAGTAQTVFVPGQSYSLYWDPSVVVGTAPENALTGYQVVVAREIQVGTATTGVQVKSYDIGNVTTFALPGTDLGATPVFVSVRAKAANGIYSGHSNTLPFIPASAPAVPGRLRRAQE